MREHFEGSLGAGHGPVPNLGRFVDSAALTPAAKDHLLGVQLRESLGRDRVASAALNVAGIEAPKAQR